MCVCVWGGGGGGGSGGGGGAAGSMHAFACRCLLPS